MSFTANGSGQYLRVPSGTGRNVQNRHALFDADELEQIAGFILEGGMQAGERAYRMKAELDSMRRREAAALARAIKGETLTIDSARERSGNGGFLSMLLKELLD